MIRFVKVDVKERGMNQVIQLEGDKRDPYFLKAKRRKVISSTNEEINKKEKQGLFQILYWKEKIKLVSC